MSFVFCCKEFVYFPGNWISRTIPEVSRAKFPPLETVDGGACFSALLILLRVWLCHRRGGRSLSGARNQVSECLLSPAVVVLFRQDLGGGGRAFPRRKRDLGKVRGSEVDGKSIVPKHPGTNDWYPAAPVSLSSALNPLIRGVATYDTFTFTLPPTPSTLTSHKVGWKKTTQHLFPFPPSQSFLLITFL